eukprot:comp12658_c0_seq1/m.7729 comp12658_c0_seq1/g.7729  ORF comp12658_c0_seq1/g.7729 comp12658_c0_seq1/m.7729 type:complete len:283 (-) comp12658_c0_seq1:316-1164(-)
MSPLLSSALAQFRPFLTCASTVAVAFPAVCQVTKQVTKAQKGVKVTETWEKDGHTFVLGPITAQHKNLIVDAFNHLSDESRERRFFNQKKELSDEELEFFTHPDMKNHYAVGVALKNPDGTLTGVAEGRYVRLKTDPEAAEIAFTVVDEFQGQGVATKIFEKLVEGAAANGIKKLEAITHSDNTGMKNLVLHHARNVKATRDAEGVLLVFNVEDALPEHERIPEDQHHLTQEERLAEALKRGAVSFQIAAGHAMTSNPLVQQRRYAVLFPQHNSALSLYRRY